MRVRYHVATQGLISTLSWAPTGIGGGKSKMTKPVSSATSNPSRFFQTAPRYYQQNYVDLTCSFAPSVPKPIKM
jgi:hypothetical protein